jgi:hypothetical protein
VRAERDRITAEYRDLIEKDEDRKQFDELLGCAKTVFPYVENHLFYVEHWFHSVFWNKMREVAADHEGARRHRGRRGRVAAAPRRDQVRRCGTSSLRGPPASRRVAPRPGRRRSPGARA